MDNLLCVAFSNEQSIRLHRLRAAAVYLQFPEPMIKRRSLEAENLRCAFLACYLTRGKAEDIGNIRGLNFVKGWEMVRSTGQKGS